MMIAPLRNAYGIAPSLGALAAWIGPDAGDRPVLGHPADRTQGRAGNPRPDHADVVPLHRGRRRDRGLARPARRPARLWRTRPPPLADAHRRGRVAAGQLHVLPAGRPAHHAGQRAVADPASAAADGARWHLGVRRTFLRGAMVGPGADVR